MNETEPRLVESESFRLAGVTHPGRVRDHNEDACDWQTAGNRLIAVVSDGVGGREAGERASAIACKTLIDRLSPLLADAAPLIPFEPDGSLDAESAVIRVDVLPQPAAPSAGNGLLKKIFRLFGG